MKCFDYLYNFWHSRVTEINQEDQLLLYFQIEYYQLCSVHDTEHSNIVDAFRKQWRISFKRRYEDELISSLLSYYPDEILEYFIDLKFNFETISSEIIERARDNLTLT